MNPNYLSDQVLDDFINQALKEDLGSGDHSSLASIPAVALNKAHLIVKENCTLAGLDLAKRIFYKVDPSLQVTYFLRDGDEAIRNDIAFEVRGNAQRILAAERLVLNCMQRMSGIATLTRVFVKEIYGTKAKLLDTRKTTPNFRIPEKWAVKIGGGGNHRIGLYDMVILKDNHVDFAGGIQQAIERTVNYLKDKNLPLQIEIETRSLDEVAQVLKVGKVNRIMLDNMSLELLREAVQLIDGQYETEASGGVSLNTIKAIAETGVDFISVGALTHSAKSVDLSLKAFN